ncbi:MAG: AURKAIP1/COX24 domain-containing protein [Nitrospirae bacterium]|nr:AURKAIP1/COX24 domain-containing protein [Nitrospirota bacterium]
MGNVKKWRKKKMSKHKHKKLLRKTRVSRRKRG